MPRNGRRIAQGAAADLRHKRPANVEYSETILDGALVNEGMPRFPLSEADTKALYAYLVKIAWDGYERKKRQPSGCRRLQPSNFLCHFFSKFQDERVGVRLDL